MIFYYYAGIRPIHNMQKVLTKKAMTELKKSSLDPIKFDHHLNRLTGSLVYIQWRSQKILTVVQIIGAYNTLAEARQDNYITKRIPL